MVSLGWHRANTSVAGVVVSTILVRRLEDCPLLARFAAELVLQLVEEVLDEATASVYRLWFGCRLAGRERFVRVAAVFSLVDGAVDAADGAVEARLPEDLEAICQ